MRVPTSAELTELSRLGALVADDLAHRGYQSVGIVRRMAQALVEVAGQATTTSSGCPVCGGPIVQPDVGRRREYCSTACRRSARRAK